MIINKTLMPLKIKEIKMLELYYKVWVDAIKYEKTKHSHLRDWKYVTLVYMSLLQGLNFGTLYICNSNDL